MRLEFLDCLMITDDTLRYREMVEKRNTPINEIMRAYRQFKPIVLAGLHLSIQGSFHHYCTPQETFENPSIYITMELGIFDVHEGYRSWVDLNTDGRLEGFKFKEEFSHYQEQTGLYAFIPVEYIEHLYQYLKRVELDSRKEVSPDGI